MMRNLFLLGESESSLDCCVCPSLRILLLPPSSNSDSASEYVSMCMEHGLGWKKLKRLKSELVDGDGSPKTSTPLNPHFEISDSMIGAFVIQDNDLVLVSRGGSIGLLPKGFSETDALQVVTSVPGGISSSAISPDESILALVSQDHGSLFIFETYCWSKPLMKVDLGRGSSPSRDSTTPQSSSLANDKSHISWRSDGQFVAISFCLDQLQTIHVYNREGVFFSRLEHFPGVISGGIAWRPTGCSTIAIPLSLPDKLCVALIEKNGLKRADVQLNIKTNNISTTKIMDIQWNSAGSILSLSLLVDSHEQIICLLMPSNHSWLTKFVRRFNVNIPYQMNWDSFDPLNLSLSSSSSFIDFKFVMRSSFSNCRLKNDNGNLAIIDGSTLNVTPFRKMKVPPPYSAYVIELDDVVRDICFGEDMSLTIITENESLYVFVNIVSEKDCVDVNRSNGIKSGCVSKDFINDVNYTLFLKENWNIGINYNNLTWIGHGNYLVSNSSCLYVITDYKKVTKKLILEDVIFNIIFFQGVTLVQLVNGLLFSYQDSSVVPWIKCNKFPEYCPIIELMDDQILLGLSETNRLYANSHEIASNVNSFILISDFLLITTNTHRLKILKVDNLFIKDSEYVRSLERGSRIVIAFESTLVLQMPRGNIEVISPKPLLIHSIKRLLDSNEYNKVYSLIRKHRINSNILVDHNYDNFIKNLSNIIEQFSDSGLCSLISELLEEDVTQTLYKYSYSVRDDKMIENKVDSVCAQILKATQHNTEKFYLPLMNCYIMFSSKRLDSALKLICKLRANGNCKIAEECLTHLCLYVDSNELFNVALGSYNLEFALYIASKVTSKDPKEYVQFLNNLKNIQPISLRHYTIDKHLKDFKGALSHASQKDFPISEEYVSDLVNMVASQRLYSYAMKILSIKNELFIPISEEYGNYLFAKRYYEDAALLFELSGNKEKSLNSWKRCGKWRNVLCHDLENSEQTCLSFIEELSTEKKHIEVAEIYLSYLKHPEEAISAYLQGGHWQEAYELIVRLKRNDLLEINFLPTLVAKSSEYLEFIHEIMNTFTSKFNRFETIIQIRSSEKNITTESNDLDEDAFSEGSRVQSTICSTSQSLTTVKTLESLKSKSTKARRKIKKKLFSSKKGSEFEDIGLVIELHSLISNVYSYRSEIHELLSALVRMHQLPLACKIQKEFKNLIELVGSSVDKIWLKKPLEFSSFETSKKNGSTTSFFKSYIPPYHILDNNLRFPPENSNILWEIQLLNNT
uniref:Elongator complex protein 1 n=1 Tax=Lepeophtheirus salmonis TaxID=72036 RepID=A0A0K2SVS6_LEPSM